MPHSLFGSRLCAARERAKFAQDSLGVSIKLDESSSSARLSRYETGIHQPPFPIAEKLARVFEVPVAYFYCPDDQIAEILLQLRTCPEADLDQIQKSILRIKYVVAGYSVASNVHYFLAYPIHTKHFKDQKVEGQNGLIERPDTSSTRKFGVETAPRCSKNLRHRYKLGQIEMARILFSLHVLNVFNRFLLHLQPECRPVVNSSRLWACLCVGCINLTCLRAINASAN